MTISDILLALLVIVSIMRWITAASQNYKLGEMQKTFARLVEIELPALTAALSEIDPPYCQGHTTAVLWPNRNNNGINLRH